MEPVKFESLSRALILLAEDDAGDQELTRRALQNDLLRANLQIVQDGKEALDYLFRREQFAVLKSQPLPDLILLDLNMPRVNGRQVLEELRLHPELDRIPVVVLTTSNQERDILKSYDLGCNSFISKPVEIGPFLKTVQELGRYWLELVTLPTAAPHLVMS